MGDKTKIEWTNATWNPIRARNIHTGKLGWHCEHVTEACRFCYAERQNDRRGASGGTGYPYKPGHLGNDVEVFLDEKMLAQPLRWSKGRMIFPCSMTDIAADFVPDAWLDKIFAVMALKPDHTYQVLTKRPARMRAYLSDPGVNERIAKASVLLSPIKELGRANRHIQAARTVGFDEWPRKNIWIGTSICDQGDADKFLPDLMATPAALHWVSAEPLLGLVDLARWTTEPTSYLDYCDAVGGPEPKGVQRLGWVVAGGESGPAARPSNPIWFRTMRDQCSEAGVPFLFKQYGEYAPIWNSGHEMMERVGKRAAGRLLDGNEHNGYPARP